MPSFKPDLKITVDTALEKARKTLLIYTRSGDILELAGKSRARSRARVMADLMGVDKMPQSKSGVNALMHEFYRRAGIKEGTVAQMEDDFNEWVQKGSAA